MVRVCKFYVKGNDNKNKKKRFKNTETFEPSHEPAARKQELY